MFLYASSGKNKMRVKGGISALLSTLDKTNLYH